MNAFTPERPRASAHALRIASDAMERQELAWSIAIVCAPVTLFVALALASL